MNHSKQLDSLVHTSHSPLRGSRLRGGPVAPRGGRSPRRGCRSLAPAAEAHRYCERIPGLREVVAEHAVQDLGRRLVPPPWEAVTDQRFMSQGRRLHVPEYNPRLRLVQLTAAATE